MLTNKAIKPKPEHGASELIAVSLKTLIDLAKPAASIKPPQLRIRAQQSGAYVSGFKGRGMEFDEARLYQPGDDIRNIDWRVTARTGKTHTKVFREERERPVFIAVDDRATMHFATRGVFKSVVAAKFAALLAWMAQHHGDRVGGQRFSDSQCRELKPQNGRHAVLQLLNMLIKPEPANSNQVSFEHALARLCQHARPGSRVYLISDFRGFNEQTASNLSKLSRHCDVVLIFIYDPLEKTLPNQGRYRFTDEQRDVLVDTADKQRLQAYQQRFADRWQRLQTFSKKNAIQLIQCSTLEDPLQQLQ